MLLNIIQPFLRMPKMPTATAMEVVVPITVIVPLQIITEV